MKFYDEARITVISGRGGDGLIAGRREAGVPFGGPAGGDGGKGGSVYFQADVNLNTLSTLRYKTKRKAKKGAPWQSKDKYGLNGQDIIIPVPVGTLLKDAQTGHVIAHLQEHGASCLVAAWWRGGAGNIHFKNARNQFPNIALLGEPRQEREILVELQLLGDVALIGTPSTGKSSLINAITHVKAKTADYEFTTLVPNLGIVEYKEKSFSMVDIPGLIAGAHEGKWLGNIFLRHILKARIRVIMLNIAKDIPGISERGTLLHEISQYIYQRYKETHEFGTPLEHIQQSIKEENGILTYFLEADINGKKETLVQKQIITVVNKYDLIDEELRKEYKHDLDIHIEQSLKKYNTGKLSEKNMFVLSAMTKKGINSFLDICIRLLDTPAPTLTWQNTILEDITTKISCINITTQEKSHLYEEWYLTENQHQKTQIREINNDKFAYFCYVLPRWNDEAELWFWNVVNKEWYLKWLNQYGAKKGDVLKIISPYQGTEDRYILRD